jgi:hypothetical protein
VSTETEYPPFHVHFPTSYGTRTIYGSSWLGLARNIYASVSFELRYGWKNR